MTKAKEKSHQYTGLLEQPIDVPIVPKRPRNALLGYTAEEEAWHKRIEGELMQYVEWERQRRWSILRSELALDAESTWQQIATALAVRHVPGFTIKKVVGNKRGRPRVWTRSLHLSLYLAVHELRQETAVDIMAACRQLKDAGREWKKFSAKRLSDEYHAALEVLGKSYSK